MDNKKILLIIFSCVFVFIILIALVTWQNRSNDNQVGQLNDLNNSAANLNTQANVPIEDNIFVATSSIVKITVDAKNGCQPDKIKIKADQEMTLSLTSMEKDVRTMKFEDPEIGIPTTSVGPGDTRDAVFTAYKKGEYKFYCGLVDQEGGYETGTLIVD